MSRKQGSEAEAAERGCGEWVKITSKPLLVLSNGAYKYPWVNVPNMTTTMCLNQKTLIFVFIAYKKHFNSCHIHLPAFLIGGSVITEWAFITECINTALGFAVFFLFIIVVVDHESKQVQVMPLRFRRM